MDKNKRIASLVQYYRSRNKDVLLLESQKKDHPASKKSFLAAEPEAWIKLEGNVLTQFSEGKENAINKDIWKALKDFRSDYPEWMFGYLGYDLKNHIEELESSNSSLLDTPDLLFFVPGTLIEIDAAGKARILKGKLPDIEEEESVKEVSAKLTYQMEKEFYLKKIRKAQSDIAEGEYYEINLSHALEFNFKRDSFSLYEKMKNAGPVPFASYISIGGLEICSSSPERFLSRKKGKVWSQPIKGTVSRDSEDEESSLLELKSEKNKAENLMIVDLVRNDLNRVAKPGSVRVRDLFEVQSFETVHQMVSTVECEVDDLTDSIEVIKACFPMGSMTGAPKIAAMQGIEELEDYKRGIYSGAIGYFEPNGDFDFNVVIRTAIIKNEKLIYPVGGAITSDSKPEQEWEETLIKAQALLKSLD